MQTDSQHYCTVGQQRVLISLPRDKPASPAAYLPACLPACLRFGLPALKPPTPFEATGPALSLTGALGENLASQV